MIPSYPFAEAARRFADAGDRDRFAIMALRGWHKLSPQSVFRRALHGSTSVAVANG